MSRINKRILTCLAVFFVAVVASFSLLRIRWESAKAERIRFLRVLCGDIRTSGQDIDSYDITNSPILRKLPSSITEQFLADYSEGRVRVIPDNESTNEDWTLAWDSRSYTISCTRQLEVRIDRR